MPSSPCCLAGSGCISSAPAHSSNRYAKVRRRPTSPAAVLAECVYVLTRIYKVSRADAATKLLSLLDYRGAITESGAVRHALTLYRDHNVDFVDALVAATAREHKWQVFSFDRDLERLAK